MVNQIKVNNKMNPKFSSKDCYTIKYIISQYQKNWEMTFSYIVQYASGKGAGSAKKTFLDESEQIKTLMKKVDEYFESQHLEKEAPKFDEKDMFLLNKSFSFVQTHLENLRSKSASEFKVWCAFDEIDKEIKENAKIFVNFIQIVSTLH